MVNYGQATAFLLLLCSIETGQGFVSQQRPRQIHRQVTTTPSSHSSSPSLSSSFPSSPLSDSTDRRSRRRKTFGAFAKASTTSLGVASTPDLRGLSDDDGLCIQTTIQNVTETCLETLTKAVEAVDDADEEAIAVKRKIVKERTTGNYEVAFPLRPSSAIESTMEESIGVSLCQVEPGVVVSDLHLNMDTLKYQEMAAADGYEVLDPSTLTNKFGTDFRGIVVSAVHKEGRAWAVGVRVGDVLTATSATLGGAMWPKTTLDGVKSAMSSRKVTSQSMAFQLQRFVEETVVDNQYELSLVKPIGLEIEENKDGFVEVTGFKDNAPRLVRYAVQIGDRIVAVDSALGDNMWPVSTVEGVISACTSRLPGQPVRIKFQRPVVDGEMQAQPPSPANVADTERDMVVQRTTTTTSMAPIATAAGVTGVASVEQLSLELQEKRTKLLQDCKAALKKYMREERSDNKKKFAQKYPLSAMVADKVVDAVASASLSLDNITLGMVMLAYLSSKQPDVAIQVFEAATGVRSDGSAGAATETIKGKKKGVLLSNAECLDRYTATSLLRAHSMKHDLSSIRRVIAAMEGENGTVDGAEVGRWQDHVSAVEGTDVSLTPHIMAYNIVLDAIAKSLSSPKTVSSRRKKSASVTALEEQSMIDDLLSVFHSLNGTSKPAKTAVSYNVVIDALSKVGRTEEAFDYFTEMKRVQIRPDKFTFTAMVKACVESGDIQELLYSMQEQGVEPDVIMFNNIIRALCDRLEWFEAKRMITVMESMGIKPDAMTYGLLMNSLLKAQKHSSCLILFETACSDPGTAPLTENVYAYTTAISAAAALNNYEKAFELVNRMAVLRIKPNLKTMTALMSACIMSDKPQLAVDIYQKIAKPDGRATAKAIEAYCLNGDFKEAQELLSAQKRYQKLEPEARMSGKQLITAYTLLVEQAVRNENYPAARAGFAQLVGSGFLPSKATLASITDAMGLNPKRNKRLRKEISEESFGFLLFVVDLLQGRCIVCDGAFYTRILSCGAEMGGLQRKIAFLMTESRSNTADKDPDVFGNTCAATIGGWEDLLQNYDDLKTEVGRSLQLPQLRVQGGAGLIRQILLAEQAVSYEGSRRSRGKTGNKMSQR